MIFVLIFLRALSLWVGSYPNGSVRTTRYSRLWLRLPQRPWLQDLERDVSLSGQGFHIHGLVSVAPSCVYSGPLTCWSKEEALLRDYFLKPLDAYSLHVTAAHAFDELIPLRFFVSSRLNSGGVRKFSLAKPLGVPCWEQADVPTKLLADLDLPQHRLRTIPVLFLPETITRLVFQKKWKSLILCAHWHASLHETSISKHLRNQSPGPYPGFPSSDSIVWDHLEESGVDWEAGVSQDVALLSMESKQFTPDNISKFVATIRQIAPTVMQHATDERETRAWSRWLRSWSIGRTVCLFMGRASLDA